MVFRHILPERRPRKVLALIAIIIIGAWIPAIPRGVTLVGISVIAIPRGDIRSVTRIPTRTRARAVSPSRPMIIPIVVIAMVPAVSPSMIIPIPMVVIIPIPMAVMIIPITMPMAVVMVR